MVDWAPSQRVALTQQLSELSQADLSEAACYQRSVAVVKTLVQRLRHDDTVTHCYRRQLLHANVIRTCLVPLLLHEGPPYEIQHLALGLLEDLSTPEESLRPSQSQTSGLSAEVSIQLSLGLRSLKEELSVPEAARALLAPLRTLLARQPAANVRGRDAECVATTLSLLRNLLHGPLSADAAEVNRYRNLLWVMFSAQLGPTLNRIMQSPNLKLWCVPVVELVSQLFKMVTSSHLHETLQSRLHPIQSDSSEDDESNTSPPDPGVDPVASAAGRSVVGGAAVAPASAPAEVSPPPPPPPAQQASFDPTSESKAQKRKLTVVRVQKRQAELTNSSTSSDEGRNVKRTTKACHHKQHRAVKTKSHYALPPALPPPPTGPAVDPCLRLLRSARAKAHKILALVNRDPSQGDIDAVLVEFTIQFLLTGCSPLVSALATSLPDKTDKSHLYWVIVYFMKPCTELRLSYANLRSLLSPDLVMLLTFEATRLVGIGASHSISLAERLHCQRQMHMLTNAIREILAGMEAIKAYASSEEAATVGRIQRQVGDLRQFRQLLLLMIGQCRLHPASVPFLRDLVLTNHLLISTQELTNKNFPTASHMALFAEPTVLLRYTSLLKFYATNAPVLNDAIFTVLHHVVGDLGRIELLFQPAVLKTFSEILASELPLLQDWLDLIEYTISRFIERQQEPRVRAALVSDAAADTETVLGLLPRTEPALCQSLQRLVACCGGRLDALATACDQVQSEAGVTVNVRWVLDWLLKLQLVPPAQYMKLTSLPGANDNDESTVPGGLQSDWDMRDPAACRRALDQPLVCFLLDCVRRELGAGTLQWLQSELVQVCLVRGRPAGSLADPLPEPVQFYSRLRGHDCPLVPFTVQHVRAVNSSLFRRLLRALRLQLPTQDVVYPTVPASLSTCYLLAVAQKVAPLDTASLGFDVAELVSTVPASESAATTDISMEAFAASELPPPPPLPPVAAVRSSNWMTLISRQKASLTLSPAGGAAAAARPSEQQRQQACSDTSMDEDDPYGPVVAGR